jgi:signal transduction histidine kinase
VLDFSKIEAGRIDLESAEFRLDAVLDHVSSLVAQKAHDKDLDLLFETAPDVPPALVGDALRLGQVITNLVSNAVKIHRARPGLGALRVPSAPATRCSSASRCATPGSA